MSHSVSGSPFRCPTCGVVVAWDPQRRIPAGSHAPFCSQRCQLVDLYGWLREEHTLPTIPKRALEDAESGGDWEQADQGEI